MCLNAPSRKASRSWNTSLSCTTASHSGQTVFPPHSTQRISHGFWWQSPHSGDTQLDPSKIRMVLKINGLDASQFSFRFAILFSHFTFTDCMELRRPWHFSISASSDWSIQKIRKLKAGKRSILLSNLIEAYYFSTLNISSIIYKNKTNLTLFVVFMFIQSIIFIINVVRRRCMPEISEKTRNIQTQMKEG